MRWRTGKARTVIGLDLGQRKDYTAVAVVDKWEVETGFDYVYWKKVTEERCGVRHLERMPLGTPYPEVVERVKGWWISCGRSRRGDGGGRDGGGAAGGGSAEEGGAGVHRDAGADHGGRQGAKEGGYWSVPKRDLVAGLQVLLQQKRLRVAGEMPEARTFLKELREMEVKVGPSGREQYGAWREGTHDDLVLAVALAYWWMGKGQQPMWGQGNVVIGGGGFWG